MAKVPAVLFGSVDRLSSGEPVPEADGRMARRRCGANCQPRRNAVHAQRYVLHVKRCGIFQLPRRRGVRLAVLIAAKSYQGRDAADRVSDKEGCKRHTRNSCVTTPSGFERFSWDCVTDWVRTSAPVDSGRRPADVAHRFHRGHQGVFLDIACARCLELHAGADHDNLGGGEEAEAALAGRP